jgi:hypothetical protein
MLTFMGIPNLSRARKYTMDKTAITKVTWENRNSHSPMGNIARASRKKNLGLRAV